MRSSGNDRRLVTVQVSDQAVEASLLSGFARTDAAFSLIGRVKRSLFGSEPSLCGTVAQIAWATAAAERTVPLPPFA
jgi:hypothetical protein